MRKLINNNAPLKRRAVALLSAAALVAALGFGAAFAGDEADDSNAALPVSDIPAAQVDGEDESAASEASNGAAGEAANAATSEKTTDATGEADASEDATEEEFPLPEDEGGASLKGAVAFTNVAPLVELASTGVAEGGYDDGVAEYATAGIMSAATNLFAAFSGSDSDGAAASDEKSSGVATYADGADEGVVLNKTAKANDDGGFTITLEAYATGEQTTVSHYDPADIVLVLDTSASMWYPMDYADSDFTAVYGSTSNQNKDGKGNDATNAYAVTDHDSTDTVSCKYTYYIKINDEYVQLRYYQNDSTHNYGSNQGWGYKDPSTSKWKYNAAVPKTSATDNNSNHVQFYKLDMSKTRLATLKTAVNSFISNVLETSPESSIAIVPFGGSVGTTTAFTSNETTLTNAVNALTATGATNSGAAMTTAASMINSLDSSHSDHKKVVVMFTDGVPTTGTAFEASVANTAISQSKTLKDNGVTVYTVGVVDGANGALSSMGTSDLNTYMHSVSSNYPEASSMTNSGKVNENLNGDSYYLTATNSSELQNIFVKISQQVGGADNATLDSSTVIKDIISPQFTVPEKNSDIQIYTADCTGAGLTFGERSEATDVTASITGDTLEVTGFDFAANWCGSHSGTYSGKKLIIEFTVSPKDGFLGGSNVPTNGAASGIYVGTECITTFEVPTVNVPIQEITIEASDKNVYLTQIPTNEQLKSGVTIKCGNVDITDPSKLEDWQKAYVTIDSSFTNVTDFDATSDGTYDVTATVSPTSNGDSSKPGTVAMKKTNTVTKKIDVFKPELTFKDSDVYYGDTAPTDYSVNKTGEVWKHGNTLSSDVNMVGTAPTLNLTYTPATGKIVDGKIATKGDIAVDVAVKIGNWNVTEYTTFLHTNCTGKTCSVPEGKKFLLHVNTCQLTVTKTGGAADESYVFDVYKDDTKYTEVTIWGNGSETIYELPVGTYTIQENTGWSWRYRANNGSAATLSAQTTSGTITCTNTSTTDKWLNGFSTIVKNVFGN